MDKFRNHELNILIGTDNKNAIKKIKSIFNSSLNGCVFQIYINLYALNSQYLFQIICIGCSEYSWLPGLYFNIVNILCFLSL